MLSDVNTFVHLLGEGCIRWIITRTWYAQVQHQHNTNTNKISINICTLTWGRLYQVDYHKALVYSGPTPTQHQHNKISINISTLTWGRWYQVDYHKALVSSGPTPTKSLSTFVHSLDEGCIKWIITRPWYAQAQHQNNTNTNKISTNICTITWGRLYQVDYHMALVCSYRSNTNTNKLSINICTLTWGRLYQVQYHNALVCSGPTPTKSVSTFVHLLGEGCIRWIITRPWYAQVQPQHQHQQNQYQHLYTCLGKVVSGGLSQEPGMLRSNTNTTPTSTKTVSTFVHLLKEGCIRWIITRPWYAHVQHQHNTNTNKISINICTLAWGRLYQVDYHKALVCSGPTPTQHQHQHNTNKNSINICTLAWGRLYQVDYHKALVCSGPTPTQHQHKLNQYQHLYIHLGKVVSDGISQGPGMLRSNTNTNKISINICTLTWGRLYQVDYQRPFMLRSNTNTTPTPTKTVSTFVHSLGEGCIRWIITRPWHAQAQHQHNTNTNKISINICTITWGRLYQVDYHKALVCSYRSNSNSNKLSINICTLTWGRLYHVQYHNALVCSGPTPTPTKSVSTFVHLLGEGCIRWIITRPWYAQVQHQHQHQQNQYQYLYTSLGKVVSGGLSQGPGMLTAQVQHRHNTNTNTTTNKNSINICTLAWGRLYQVDYHKAFCSCPTPTQHQHQQNQYQYLYTRLGKVVSGGLLQGPGVLRSNTDTTPTRTQHQHQQKQYQHLYTCLGKVVSGGLSQGPGMLRSNTNTTPTQTKSVSTFVHSLGEGCIRWIITRPWYAQVQHQQNQYQHLYTHLEKVVSGGSTQGPGMLRSNTNTNKISINICTLTWGRLYQVDYHKALVCIGPTPTQH